MLVCRFLKILSFIFIILVENKRKIDDSVENPTAKTKRLETKLKCSDLVVLNIPYNYDEQKLKEYFGQFGELLMLQVIMKHEKVIYVSSNIYVIIPTCILRKNCLLFTTLAFVSIFL